MINTEVCHHVVLFWHQTARSQDYQHLCLVPTCHAAQVSDGTVTLHTTQHKSQVSDGTVTLHTTHYKS